MQLLPLALQYFFFWCPSFLRATWGLPTDPLGVKIIKKGHSHVLSCIFYAHTFPCLLLLHVISFGPECFESLKQWLFDISIRRSPISTRRCEGEVGRSERAQSKVFSNTILLKVIFLVEWISNCVCLHTLAGRWSLAENTITMEICVGLLTRWLNLTESK